MTQSTKSNSAKVIVSLHLPRIRQGDVIQMDQIEAYAMANMSLFVEGGLDRIMLQDRSFHTSQCRPEIISMMSALGRLIRHEFPSVELGIIIEAHDPVSALSIAQACGATFIRVKVFIGAMLKSAGIQQGCGVQAIDFRNTIRRNDIKIFADVYDRTGFPLLNIPITHASNWAVNIGADALILTGSSFQDSIEYLKLVKASGVSKPLYMGGGVTIENVKTALDYADGVIVSSSLKLENSKPEDLLQWDVKKIAKFMSVVNHQTA